MYFGYMNRNYEEELDIPVGPSNTMEPGPDRGQPTHFLTRRHKNVFAVVVPKDFGDKKIVWTITSRGTPEKVTGSLNPAWQIDVSRETESGNTPPVMKVGPDQTIILSAAANVTVAVTDDGLPKRRRQNRAEPGASAESQGGSLLTVEWSKYRGPGNVTFAPAKQDVIDGNATTKATFSAPGAYTIDALADDGSGGGGSTSPPGFSCCWTHGWIKVTVTPAPSPSTRGQR